MVRRPESTLTVALIDVDNLKAVNDQEGHAAGDELPRAVVQALLGRLRAAGPAPPATEYCRPAHTVIPLTGWVVWVVGHRGGLVPVLKGGLAMACGRVI